VIKYIIVIRGAHNNQNQINTKVQQVNRPIDGAIETTKKNNNSTCISK